MNEFLAPDQRDLLRKTMLAEFCEEECQLFYQQVERTKLDPFKRQIYASRRWNKELGRYVLTPLVSIDGFRLIANRSGRYAGQRGPFWAGQDGVWLKDSHGDPMPWISKDPPAAAMVAVLRSDFAEPLFAIARWDSYVQRDSKGQVAIFWLKMPDLMIGKVAEALALRRAFPDELSGLYSAEEMAQADNPDPPAYQAAEPRHKSQTPAYQAAEPRHKSQPPADPADFSALLSELEKFGWNRKDWGKAERFLKFTMPDVDWPQVKYTPGKAAQILSIWRECDLESIRRDWREICEPQSVEVQS